MTSGGPVAGVPASGRRRSTASLLALGLAALVVFAVLVALGAWQVRRLSWKEDLIARVDARVSAPPVAPPPRSAWSAVSADGDEYRHVTVRGTFLNDRDTTVQAVTELGPGVWVVTPLRTDNGDTILVNRGFVPSDTPGASVGSPSGPVVVTGLLRLTEPRGGFLRHNDPAAGRWYSRDVQAIAAARGLGPVAPFFIDADATPNPGGYPVGGLTVVRFPNNHLVYALTWFSLAALLGGATLWLGREEWRRRMR